jgi:hypothetical protein
MAAEQQIMPAQLKILLQRLSPEECRRILASVLWAAFGAFDKDGHMSLDPDHEPNRAELETMMMNLRQEFTDLLKNSAGWGNSRSSE